MYDISVNHHGVLFNLGFHPIILYLFPMAWLYSIPFNFIVDSIVFIVGMKLFGFQNKAQLYKKRILFIVVFGFLADIIGACLYTFFESIQFIKSEDVTKYWPSNFIGVTISILVAGIFIYIFNYFITFKKIDIMKKQRIMISLLFVIITMPYLFYMKTYWRNGIWR